MSMPRYFFTFYIILIFHVCFFIFVKSSQSNTGHFTSMQETYCDQIIVQIVQVLDHFNTSWYQLYYVKKKTMVDGKEGQN